MAVSNGSKASPNIGSRSSGVARSGNGVSKSSGGKKSGGGSGSGAGGRAGHDREPDRRRGRPAGVRRNDYR
jgi:hypothetical protein